MRSPDTLRTLPTSLVSRSNPNCTIVNQTNAPLIHSNAPFLQASTPLIYILFNATIKSDRLRDLLHEFKRIEVRTNSQSANSIPEFYFLKYIILKKLFPLGKIKTFKNKKSTNYKVKYLPKKLDNKRLLNKQFLLSNLIKKIFITFKNLVCLLFTDSKIIFYQKTFMHHDYTYVYHQ